mgnify:FL=1
MFPAETVPDGAILAPHHYTYGALLALLAIGIVWDNYTDREPLYAAAGVGAGLFGFLSVWPYYPVAGALLALAGPLLAIVAVLLGTLGLSFGGVWDDYPVRMRIAVVLACLIALDDGVEHAFGVWTPLDAIWGSGLYNRAPAVVGAMLAIGVGAAVVISLVSEQT